MIGAIWLYMAYMISIRDGPVGIHLWNISLETASKDAWICGNYFVSTISTPALGFAKISLFLLYIQLFWPFCWLRICVYIGASLTAAFYGAVTIVQFYYTTLKDGYTPFTYLLTPWEAKSEILYVPISAVGLGIDMFLLILPIRSVPELNLQDKKKIGLILMFLTGIL
ncbi:MAG: hypothetical protein M1822_005015 [Bathelium mastoideum]|nr:MAG: hypothetical protein M1822_005015 [Bathelium mastoideum]